MNITQEHIDFLSNTYGIKEINKERDHFSVEFMGEPSQTLEPFSITYRIDIPDYGFERLMKDLVALKIEEDARKQYPSVKLAWERYRVVLALSGNSKEYT